MERSTVIPHISWSGPQPVREVDAYLLAMLLRMYASGLDDTDESRDAMQHPSVLTTENLRIVAIMYAFYKEKMEEQGVSNSEAMLKLIRSSEEDSVCLWLSTAKAAINQAENELIEFVETPGHTGFTAFG